MSEISPLLPILSFGSTKLNKLELKPNYSIEINSSQSESSSSASTSSTTSIPTESIDPTLINEKFVLQSVLKAKRIAVVCGAGISCASGIPDFRSTEGLFESLKKQFPEAKLNSGKDLFDASLFSSEANAAIFYTMISELKTMSDNAEPTAFHKFLKSLDDEGKLHRVYTQNIDGLEERAGLSYGLGSKAPPSPRKRSASLSPVKSRSSTLRRPPSPDLPSQFSHSTPSTPPSNSKASTSAIVPVPGIPKCIPLHGHLATLSCPHCSHTISITPHLPLLASGSTLTCPECTSLDLVRTAIGGRSRGIGMMKPDVVLYGETHREGERVGEITRKDLMGVRPDLLLVVGTSLKVPGTKLLVRELAKVIRPAWTWSKASSPDNLEEEEDEDEMPIASGSTSISIDSTTSKSTITAPPPSKKRKQAPKPEKVSVIYLNYEFPKPSSEWKDVFDVWMRGDVQEFVNLLQVEKLEEAERLKKKLEDKELMLKKREDRKVEKELLMASSSQGSNTSNGTVKKVASPKKKLSSPVKVNSIVKLPKIPKSKFSTPPISIKESKPSKASTSTSTLPKSKSITPPISIKQQSKSKSTTPTISSKSKSITPPIQIKTKSTRSNSNSPPLSSLASAPPTRSSTNTIIADQLLPTNRKRGRTSRSNSNSGESEESEEEKAVVAKRTKVQHTFTLQFNASKPFANVAGTSSVKGKK